MIDRYINSIMRDGGWISFTHWSTSWNLYDNHGRQVQQGSSVSKYVIAATDMLTIDSSSRCVTIYYFKEI